MSAREWEKKKGEIRRRWRDDISEYAKTPTRARTAQERERERQIETA